MPSTFVGQVQQVFNIDPVTHNVRKEHEQDLLNAYHLYYERLFSFMSRRPHAVVDVRAGEYTNLGYINKDLSPGHFKLANAAPTSSNYNLSVGTPASTCSIDEHHAHATWSKYASQWSLHQSKPPCAFQLPGKSLLPRTKEQSRLNVSGTNLEVWLRSWCSGEAGMHRYCKSQPSKSELDQCAHDMSAHSLWPTGAELLTAAHLFNRSRSLFIGDSTVENKWLYLRDIHGVTSACTKNTTGVCMAGGMDSRESMGPMKCDWRFATKRTDFNFVLWNLGLWHLQLKPNRSGVFPLTFTQYMTNLHTCAQHITKTFPNALIMYKMTNVMCTEKLTVGGAQDAAAAWASKSTYPQYDMQLTAIGTRSLHAAERTLAGQRRIQLIDPHLGGLCHCTGYGDGMHYAPLIPHFICQVSDVLTSTK